MEPCGSFKVVQTLVRIAKVPMSNSFPSSVTQFIGNAKMLVVILYGLIKVTQTVVSITKIAISSPLSNLVSQFFDNSETFVVVINSLFKITETLVRIAKNCDKHVLLLLCP